MSKLTFRGGAAALALAALAAPAAHAATPSQIRPEGLVDVSSDGRYVLLSGGALVDRTGDNSLPTSTLLPIAVADRAPIVLAKNASETALYVRTTQDPDGTVVATGTIRAAELVQNGTAVIYSTTSPAQIIKKDLASGTSTVLMTRASLLDASEDGRVITYLRGVSVPSRPSGSTPVPGDPGASWVSPAVGYQVGLDAPRLVAVQKISERAPGGDAFTGCPSSVEFQTITPTGLEISQNGSQGGGEYSLVLTSSRKPYGGYPFSYTSIDRLTADGPRSIGSSDGQVTAVTVRVDPVSGAYARILDDKANGFPLVNEAEIMAPSGLLSTSLAVLPAEGSTDTLGRIQTAIPFAGGTGAAYAGALRAGGPTGGPTWTYTIEGLRTDGSTAPWQTLPRTGDRIDSSATTAEVTWLECKPVAGTFSDYVGQDLKTTGTSAGTVAIGGPLGKIPVASSRVAISWYGLPIWSKSAQGNAAFYRLPGIPAGLPGFKLSVQVKLTDGTVLSKSTALRRTR